MTGRLTIDGHDIAVSTLGDGPVPMVMIHCSLASHRSLARLAGVLADTHRIRLIDMPGHGNSGPWDGRADIQGLIAKAAAQVAEPGCHVFGHSFGGTAALRMALDHPGLVGRLSLYEPVCFTPVIGTPAYDAYLTRFAPFLAEMAAGRHDRAAEVFNGLWGGSSWKVLPAAVRRDMAARIWFIEASERAFAGDMGGVFAPGRIEALSCDVTLMLGRRTEPIMPHVIDALHARLPAARIVRLEEAGHMGPLTHPGRVARAMAQPAIS